MISRLVEQKEALGLMSLSNNSFPRFVSIELKVLQELEEILKPFHTATKGIQDRKTTIASVIPIYLVVFLLKYK
jgi:hypothetical protein